MPAKPQQQHPGFGDSGGFMPNQPADANRQVQPQQANQISQLIDAFFNVVGQMDADSANNIFKEIFDAFGYQSGQEIVRAVQSGNQESLSPDTKEKLGGQLTAAMQSEHSTRGVQDTNVYGPSPKGLPGAMTAGGGDLGGQFDQGPWYQYVNYLNPQQMGGVPGYEPPMQMPKPNLPNPQQMGGVPGDPAMQMPMPNQPNPQQVRASVLPLPQPTPSSGVAGGMWSTPAVDPATQVADLYARNAGGTKPNPQQMGGVPFPPAPRGAPTGVGYDAGMGVQEPQYVPGSMNPFGGFQPPMHSSQDTSEEEAWNALAASEGVPPPKQENQWSVGNAHEMDAVGTPQPGGSRSGVALDPTVMQAIYGNKASADVTLGRQQTEGDIGADVTAGAGVTADAAPVGPPSGVGEGVTPDSAPVGPQNGSIMPPTTAATKGATPAPEKPKIAHTEIKERVKADPIAAFSDVSANVKNLVWDPDPKSFQAVVFAREAVTNQIKEDLKKWENLPQEGSSKTSGLVPKEDFWARKLRESHGAAMWR